MKQFPNAKEFSEASGISLENLTTTFTQHTKLASGEGKDPFGKRTSAMPPPSSLFHIAWAL